MFLELLQPVAGVAVAAWPVPSAPSLLGQPARSQALVLGFDAGCAWTQSASSNALDLRFGWL